MATNWTNPTIITQYAEETAEEMHIPWDESDNFVSLKGLPGQSVGTQGTLYHYARSPKTDVLTKTYYLRLTGYNFINIPETISGIELRLTGQRGGRVTDDTIQLCHNGQLIGENQATLTLDPIKHYGGIDNLWGVEGLLLTEIDSTFGVVVRLKSHPKWPHNTAAFLDSVELRIY